MKDRKTNFLVTLVFDENQPIKEQVNAEYSFKNEIIKDLQRLVKGKSIKHFVVADDEVINDKLKDEPKTGRCQWIKYDHRTVCPKRHDIDDPYWRIPQNMEKVLKYCPYCGKEIEIEQ